VKFARNKYVLSILLLSVAAIWGSTFVVMKSALHRQDVNSFLACRFAAATLVLIALRPNAIKLVDRKFLLKGVIAGIFLSSGYVLQTFGLTLTTIAKTGFITGLYAIFVPIILAGVLGRTISAIKWVAVVIATVGLMILSLKGFSFGIGEFLVFVSAIFFALHIVALSEWSSGLDTYALTILQLGTCAILTFLASLKNGFQLPPDSGVWWAILYTSIFATAFAFLVQTWAQSFMPGTSVAILLTMEYIFAAVFAVIFAHESFSRKILLGGSMVISAMYLIIWSEGRQKSPEVVRN
jgi:drug/metabolite transporter (DMT)-like permease